MYDEVSGAFWSFQHRLSPGNPWFVVASRVMPWCSSTWSRIQYTILRPGPHLKVLLDRSEVMWRGSEDFGAIVADRSSADVRFHGDDIDKGFLTRLFVRHYEVPGDSIKRIQPIAINARDFVDEWIVSR